MKKVYKKIFFIHLFSIVFLLPTSMMACRAYTTKKDHYEEALYKLVINGKVSQEMLVVLLKNNGSVFVKVEDLNYFPINLKKIKKPTLINKQFYVDIKSIPSILVKIDKKKFTIYAVLPRHYLQQQNFNLLDKSKIEKYTPTAYGGFINYNATLMNHENGRQSGAATPEVNVFLPHGYFFSNFFVSSNNNFNKKGTIIRRMESFWGFDNPETMTTFKIGDITTHAFPLIGATRIGGIKFGTKFDTKPDFITYYQPSITGSTSFPTTIDLYANNLRVMNKEINAGNYALNNIPTLSSDGNLTLKTTDITGKKETIIIPYFIMPSLLKPGLSEYSLEVGAKREKFLTKNLDYRDMIGVAHYRYGITKSWTAALQGQMTRHLGVLGIDNSFGFQTLGKITLSAATSHHQNKSGWRMGASYQKKIDFLNFGVNTNISRKKFSDISNWPESYAPQLSTQASLGFALGNFGNLSLNHTNALESTGKRLKIMGGTYTLSVINGLNSTLSLTKQITEPKNTTALLGLSYVLGGGKSVNVSHTRHSQDRKGTRTIEFQKSMTEDVGMEYKGRLSYQQEIYNYEADIKNKSTKGIITLNTSGKIRNQIKGPNNKNIHQQYINLTGAIVSLDGSTFLTQNIQDSVALVKVDNIPDIKVFGQNRLVGKTNKEGKTLIPNLASYHENILSVDVGDLPVGTIIPQNKKEIFVTSHSGIIVKFDTKKFTNLSIILSKGDGGFIPEGSIVTLNGRSKKYIVGYDGMVFFHNLTKNTKILKGLVKTSSETCQFKIKLPQDPSCINKVIVKCQKSS